MRRRLTACLALLVTGVPATAHEPGNSTHQHSAPKRPGDEKRRDTSHCAHRYDAFARGADQIWECVAGDGASAFRFRSPDGRSTVTAQLLGVEPDGAEPLQLKLSGAIGKRTIRFSPGASTELKWRADGRALFFNVSNAGVNGIYDAIVLLPIAGRLEQRDISGLVRRRFGDPMHCGEPPNIGAMGWLPNGNLIVVAEIVHHSFCDSYGTFHAYEVDPRAQRIVRTYSQTDAKRRFRTILGSELAQAQDRCERSPVTCTVAYLREHPELDR